MMENDKIMLFLSLYFKSLYEMHSVFLNSHRTNENYICTERIYDQKTKKIQKFSIRLKF